MYILLLYNISDYLEPMIKPIISDLESKRLNELEAYNILDTLDEREYDDIAEIASQLCNTPISLISLIDKNRQWLKSNLGLDIKETPREIAFCAHAINDLEEPLVINDARKDHRFHDNPLVIQSPFVVFYAGVPLISPSGFGLGTLCVIDHQPRKLEHSQIKALKALANQVVCLLELRKSRTTLTYCNYELEKKNSELEQFAFIAAHDIKSPLNSISSTINFLMADESLGLTQDAKSAILPIDNSARQLRNLVDGILEYSRGDKILLQQKEHFDFCDLIKNIINLFDSRHTHHFIYPNGEKSIFANKTALKQVLINLVSNALKYNDKSRIVIEIGISESKGYYTFFIKDNGAGIRKEDQAKIFEIFEILPIYGRKEIKNSGIGLATVKKLVDGLGGIISVESTPGRGSRFEFSIEK